MVVPSDTETWKVSVEFARPSGAVKVGDDADELLSETAVPPVCVHV